MKTSLKENGLWISRARKRHGRCYELCFYVILNSDGWDLVHGEVKVDPKRIPGMSRMRHAWVEKNGMVYDPVLNAEFMTAAYYSKYEAISIVRYTKIEACKMLSQFRWIGPWHEVTDPRGCLNPPGGCADPPGPPAGLRGQEQG